MTILTILGGIGRHILEVEIIHRGIENYLDDTKTVWDNVLWRALESAAGIESPAERAAVVETQAAKVQVAYDTVKADVARGCDGGVEAIKAAVEAQGLPFFAGTEG